MCALIPLTTYISVPFVLFQNGDKQRLIRQSVSMERRQKSNLLFARLKDKVPCPTPNITNTSIVRNPPSQAQGTMGPGTSRTPWHLCQHRAGGKGLSSSHPSGVKTSQRTTISFASTSVLLSPAAPCEGIVAQMRIRPMIFLQRIIPDRPLLLSLLCLLGQVFLF